jgi:hypothetical protein
MHAGTLDAESEGKDRDLSTRFQDEVHRTPLTDLSVIAEGSVRRALLLLLR